jgi:hypothetical protein
MSLIPQTRVTSTGGGANARIYQITGFQDFPAGVKNGDYGYIAAGGEVYRYRAACTIAAGAGGGTMPIWLSLAEYAGTPVVQGYANGTETTGAGLAATLAGQGLTVSVTGTGTVTTSAGELILDSPSASSAILTCLSTTVVAGTKIGIQGRARGAQSAVGNIHFTITDGTQFSYHTQNGTGGSILLRGAAAGTNGLATGAYRDGAPTRLPNNSETAEWINVVDEGAAVMSRLIRAGIEECASTRATTLGNFSSRVYINASSSAANTASIRWQFLRIVSF